MYLTIRLLSVSGGISTFGTATPLILVDGVQRSIENLTLAEIERVEVLKDAVSSAMYGVQGANGAVLITTKRGKEGFRAAANYRVSLIPLFACRNLLMRRLMLAR